MNERYMSHLEGVLNDDSRPDAIDMIFIEDDLEEIYKAQPKKHYLNNKSGLYEGKVLIVDGDVNGTGAILNQELNFFMKTWQLDNFERCFLEVSVDEFCLGDNLPALGLKTVIRMKRENEVYSYGKKSCRTLAKFKNEGCFRQTKSGQMYEDIPAKLTIYNRELTSFDIHELHDQLNVIINNENRLGNTVLRFS